MNWFLSRPAFAKNSLWPVVFCNLGFWLSAGVLSACAMSAVIANEGYCLADFPQQDPGYLYSQYNDPWDYLGFVMANSRPSSNSDGYGAIAYSGDSHMLADAHKWFKRIMRPADFDAVYYTGAFVRQGLNELNYPPDVLDVAMFQMKNPSQDIAIALCHARNATGVTLGNHPFWFNHNGRSYTLMHNGNANSARAYMISRITQMNSEVDWFNVHPSNFFADSDPWSWVDSEVLLHYIMSYVISCHNDTRKGIITAMQDLRFYLNTVGWGVYNFVFSDGEKLYAFRSTPISGAYAHYQLSYKDSHGFYGIRTQAPGPGFIQMQAKELVVFSRSERPQHFLIDTRQYLSDAGFLPNPQAQALVLYPNPLPVDNSLRVKLIADLPKNTRMSLEIYNLRGQLLSRQEIDKLDSDNTLEFKPGNLPSGVYLLKVRSDTFCLGKRFTVVK